MTSWKRKQVKQHKELHTPKYRQRVVPLKKLKELHKQEEKEIMEEIKDAFDDK